MQKGQETIRPAEHHKTRGNTQRSAGDILLCIQIILNENKIEGVLKNAIFQMWNK
jgi:hypothetical protein